MSNKKRHLKKRKSYSQRQPIPVLIRVKTLLNYVSEKS